MIMVEKSKTIAKDWAGVIEYFIRYTADQGEKSFVAVEHSPQQFAISSRKYSPGRCGMRSRASLGTASGKAAAGIA